MSAITTHVLDLATGRPAAGVQVALDRRTPRGWEPVAEAVTDPDGRVRDWPGAAPGDGGVHRIRFATGAYFAAAGVASFHPEVAVVFEVADAREHCHVPLLLSPFGYSTYRGS
jgi:5-hydroxyisourate hydrolase